MLRTELYYTTTVGYLKGKMPNGEEVVVHHPQKGAKGYWLYWHGHCAKSILDLRKYGFTTPEETLGIPLVRTKHSGEQEGYHSQPNFMAVWQYLVNRYNAGHEDVVFSSVFPSS